jgi:tryptophan synthase alpha chain
MKNRISTLYTKKKSEILNVYFTAGYPKLDSLPQIVKTLDDTGVDLIEIGMPYSDPLADGETIQNSSTIALKNGMVLDLMFDQIAQTRSVSEIPIVLMGYYNQLLQYGTDKFFDKLEQIGVDGIIIPDLPMEEYERDYKEILDKKNIGISFLITPHTSDHRISKALNLSTSFTYIVSSASITGSKNEKNPKQQAYFKKVKKMCDGNFSLIGFGIHDHASYMQASTFSNGAIIGSAFIKHIGKKGADKNSITEFVNSIRNK